MKNLNIAETATQAFINSLIFSLIPILLYVIKPSLFLHFPVDALPLVFSMLLFYHSANNSIDGFASSEKVSVNILFLPLISALTMFLTTFFSVSHYTFITSVLPVIVLSLFLSGLSLYGKKSSNILAYKAALAIFFLAYTPYLLQIILMPETSYFSLILWFLLSSALLLISYKFLSFDFCTQNVGSVMKSCGLDAFVPKSCMKRDDTINNFPTQSNSKSCI